jgi:uncharacterized protein YchJ
MKNEIGEWTYFNPKFTTKIQSSGYCGSGERIDK